MSDRRSTFANARVAHTSLRSEIAAPRYDDGTLMRIKAPVGDLYAGPDSAALERQLLRGHGFRVLEQVGARSFGRAEDSGYVGYIPSAALAGWVAPTHRVRVRQSLLFAAADIKCPDPVPVYCGAHLTITDVTGPFARTDDGRYGIAAHLDPIGQVEPDPVAVAERLLGAPYLWGGNSAAGLDCSGLVQLALSACGIACPGDSDQQRALGHAVAAADIARGDLLFWPGHVALAVDGTWLVHANAHAMAVAHERTAQVLARIDAQGDGPFLGARRVMGA